MSLKTEHTTEQNRMDEKWMRHLSAVLIPKIMHVFAFGILIFLSVQSHGVRQSSAAPKDTRQKTKSKWNETFYISKSITIKYIKLLNVARSREREREKSREIGSFANTAAPYSVWRAQVQMEANIFMRLEMSSRELNETVRWDFWKKQQVEVDLYANFSDI